MWAQLCLVNAGMLRLGAGQLPVQQPTHLEVVLREDCVVVCFLSCRFVGLLACGCGWEPPGPLLSVL